MPSPVILTAYFWLWLEENRPKAKAVLQAANVTQAYVGGSEHRFVLRFPGITTENDGKSDFDIQADYADAAIVIDCTPGLRALFYTLPGEEPLSSAQQDKYIRLYMRGSLQERASRAAIILLQAVEHATTAEGCKKAILEAIGLLE